MDFLFAIPSFILKLISSLFYWVFSLISGILGVMLLPFKLLWGLFMGVGQTIISIVLLPILLFSNSGDISATQPVVITSDTVSNNYHLEEIYNDIIQLEKAGRNMEFLRSYENLEECGSKMRGYQDKVKILIDKTNALPIKYKMTLGSAAIRLNSCVSCSTEAKKQCEMIRLDLSDYQSMMNEE
ncbi:MULTISPECIES: hypothetical protein [Planktothricoides]|uniref:Uncharacterized protein n=1 Tax=Planktothricoides raciborskii FACHB-1370 TaxID=2949576 RepID=A0ABR8EPT3_9CYAN|nr:MULTISPECIES: hypothetical protein [Planktothricoides]KOR33639.1 hypothetical protein AM228_28675 [Planktothricoides sp. SR001]MBD2547978.1 hypothetical protein [Planktothricoides raciborskii FACHB-1370]MBD2586371.1 hypothetical protein [Planktothricoides raciborskii FACHB-1261]